jgi:hypothetical protein
MRWLFSFWEVLFHFSIKIKITVYPEFLEGSTNFTATAKFQELLQGRAQRLASRFNGYFYISAVARPVMPELMEACA